MAGTSYGNEIDFQNPSVDRWRGQPFLQEVDVLGIVSNQLASITQPKDGAMSCCWTDVLSIPAHLGDTTVEERPPSRVRQNRRVKETTTTKGINAVLRSKVLGLVSKWAGREAGIHTGIPTFVLMPAPVTVTILDAAPNRLAILPRWKRSSGRTWMVAILHQGSGEQ